VVACGALFVLCGAVTDGFTGDRDPVQLLPLFLAAETCWLKEAWLAFVPEELTADPETELLEGELAEATWAVWKASKPAIPAIAPTARADETTLSLVEGPLPLRAALMISPPCPPPCVT
jgi:hypothetical protein